MGSSYLYSNTLLHKAARFGHDDLAMDIVWFLVLEKGANMELKKRGMTPLDCARQINQRVEVKLTLLRHQLIQATLRYSLIGDNPTPDPLSQLRALQKYEVWLELQSILKKN